MNTAPSNKQVIIITNTIAPYAAHNVNYLAVPNGLTYQFRYKKKRFQSPSSVSVSDWIRGLKGKSGILVLRDFDRDRFIPLRRFHIHNIEDFAEFVFIDLEFGDYVRYSAPTDADTTALTAVRERYSEEIGKLIPAGVEHTAGAQLSKLIFEVGLPYSLEADMYPDPSAGDDSLAWFSLVKLVAQISAFNGVSFYKVIGIYPNDFERKNRLRNWLATHIPALRLLKASESLRPVELAGRRKGYKLKGGQTYILRFLQSVPAYDQNLFQPFDFEILTPTQHMQPMRPKYMIDGAYDRFEFVMYAVPQASSKVSSYLVLGNNQNVNAVPFESKESESSSHRRVSPAGQKQTMDGSASSSSPATLSLTTPSAFISIEIGWTLLEWVWRQLLPWPAVMIALILWVFAEPLTVSNSLLGSYSIKVEYVRYLSLFLMAFAFQNWTAFTGAFKIAEKGQT